MAVKDLNWLQAILKILFVELFADFVQKHLTPDASTALATALVSSRLDYYNSTMFHSKSPSGKTATVQNSLARVVTSSTRFTAINHYWTDFVGYQLHLE